MGMEALLRRDRPTVIVEGWPGGEAARWLEAHGHAVTALGESANIVAIPGNPAATPGT